MDSEENTEPNLSSIGKDETVSNENIEEPSNVTVTEPAPSVVSDMLDAGLVKTSEQFKFNFQIGKNSKKMSEEEISKISEMVAGLAKYNDCEEEFPDSNLKIPSKQKKGKSPRKSQGIQESSSLSQFIDSKLASLHPSDGGDKDDRSQAKDDKKPHKTGVHVASVSAEKQLQFESMFKEDLVSATVGVEELDISTGAQPKVKVQSETIDTQQTESAGNQQKQKEEQIKGSPKKKGEKKSPKKKGNQGQSQISMGKRSPQRRIEVIDQMKIWSEMDQTERPDLEMGLFDSGLGGSISGPESYQSDLSIGVTVSDLTSEHLHNIPGATGTAADMSRRSGERETTRRPNTRHTVPGRTSCRSVGYYDPKHVDVDRRIATFCTAREFSQTPQAFAYAGFFYNGLPGMVQCFSCGVEMDSWKEDDIPLLEHGRECPDCDFIQAVIRDSRTEQPELVNDIGLAFVDSRVGSEVMEMGFRRREVLQAVYQLNMRGGDSKEFLDEECVSAECNISFHGTTECYSEVNDVLPSNRELT